MTKLAPITLDNGAVIYVEASDDVAAPDIPTRCFFSNGEILVAKTKCPTFDA